MNERGDHYRGLVAFTKYGLKETVPMLLRLSPETTLNGQWLAVSLAFLKMDSRKHSHCRSIIAINSENGTTGANAGAETMTMHY